MRREHFTALQPICPLCRIAPIAITSIARQSGSDILEGILGCTNPECQREYPVIDGIPILVAAIRGWLAANPLQVLQRDDLSAEMHSLIGDVLGTGSPFDTLRQQVGIYASGHYENDSASQLLDCALPAVGAANGPVLDIGCSVGGTTFALAERLGRLTIGIDLNFAMLRVASRALREGRVQYDARRVGLVYDRRELTFAFPRPELVDFWCCDAAALPFAQNTFATVCALNLVDCVASPRDLIDGIATVLQNDGTAILSTPYDWTPTATPVEHWLGGHSQRGPDRGASEPALRALLAGRFEILAEEENVSWRLRLHERSAIDYLVHLIVARRVN